MSVGLASLTSMMSRMFSRLARDASGNVLLIFAASLFPLLALIGSGIDMGRGYMVQARLQQACDSAVLAARQRLGTGVVLDGEVPDEVAEAGQRFFNLNFRDEIYGTEDRQFVMALQGDYSITGAADIIMPTAIMGVFGFDELPIAVTCKAQMNQSNADIMMVLDVTGSMSSTNPGDDKSRLESLKDVVRTFVAQMNGNKGTARMRFGFVPYATNVNVGALLKDSWMTTDWKYQSREWKSSKTEIVTRTYDQKWTYVSGSNNEVVIKSQYDATRVSGGNYACTGTLPADAMTIEEKTLSSADYPFAGPPAGTQKVAQMWRKSKGKTYSVTLSGTKCLVQETRWVDYIENFERVTEPYERPLFQWHYNQIPYSTADWQDSPLLFNGCIEERDTYEIDDYDNVDLNRALDLDINLVPTDDPSTQWRPQAPQLVYARYKNGVYTTQQVVTNQEFYKPQNANRAYCPPAARKLTELTNDQLNTYLDTLFPAGNTYHDIGMLWGARLLSKDGLFADENADMEDSGTTSRHLIFLTDGETAPSDTSYSTYGFEPIDKRRWSQSSPLTLKDTVEKRFSFICEETKKQNIMVWVISFGTEANDVMEDCAGSNRYYVADDAAELQETFNAIADRIGELRIGQ